MKPPPNSSFGHISLPRTNLHYMRVGNGPPLVIVSSTISVIRQWQSLAQLMGQRYTTYFFELPGHGGSSPYPEKFKSHMVPQTVATFMEAMGYQTFNLMGFSFGGLLAMRTLEALHDRIDDVFLLAPCVSKRALLFLEKKQWGLKCFCRALRSPTFQKRLLQMMHCGPFDRILLAAFSGLGNLDKEILKTRDVLHIPQSTVDVLAYTLQEIFSVDYSYSEKPFPHKCYFGMSIYDDLLDYSTTLGVVEKHFDDLTVQQFTLPYHQPPVTPTHEWLMDKFGGFLDLLPA